MAGNGLQLNEVADYTSKLNLKNEFMNKEKTSLENENQPSCLGAVSSSAFVNREGIILKVGMKVKGFITYQRSYMRTGDKDITGTIISKHGRLYVNSDSEPEKNYPLSKFAHNWLTQDKVAWLEVV